MSEFKVHSRFLTWFMALMLSALAAGCGESGNSTSDAAIAPVTANKAVTAYSFVGFPAAAGTLDETAKTIAVTLPSGTAVTALVATFTTTGTGAKVGTTAQTSAATANGFTAPVAYIVTAIDGTTATYTVGVSVASVSAKANTAFSFAGLPGATGTINEAAKTIAVTVPSGTDMTTPTNSNLTTAVSDMETAYTDAAGRPTPDFLNLGTGEIGGKTLTPGIYTWTTGLTISSDVTITGGANDVWIFQIPGNVTMSAARNVILGGNAKAKNIFWQFTGFADIGAGAHFEGIMLSQTAITLKTGASMNGRALAQTAVALDQNVVTKPAP